MPEQSHHPSGPLVLAIALAAAAGFVDAHIYVNVTPVFVANMSGNLIHLGILVGDGSWIHVAGSLLALAAFGGGVVIATVHHDRQVAQGETVRPGFLLSIEAALLVVLTGLLVSTGVIPQRHRDLVAIALGAVAMGIQAGALRRVGEIAVATTYGTGAIVRISEKLVLAMRRADRATGHRRRVAIAVLAVVLVSYVAGAVVATLAGSSPRWLAVPSIVLIACAASGRLARGDHGSPEEARPRTTPRSG